MNLTALLKLLGLSLNGCEISGKMLVNGLLSLLVCPGLLYNQAESWRCVRDEAVDELLQVRVQIDWLDVLHS